MFLALSIARCEDKMICDLAETYHIFDYRGLPVSLLTTLVFGLRDNSRVKMFFSDTQIPLETILLASAIDNLSFLSWTKTKDAEKGRNKPQSVLDRILKKHEVKDDLQSFDTGEDFDVAWAKIQRGM